MKILFLTHSFFPKLGGIERTSEILSTYFTDYGAEVHLITWTVDNAINEFPFHVIRNPGIYTLLKEFLWADIIFENNPCLKLSWPVIFFSKQHFVVLHTWLTGSNSQLKSVKLKELWLKKANHVIAVSNKLREIVFPSAEVIKNSYDNNLFKRLPEVEKTKDFVFLGRLVSDKGVDLALMLLKLLNEDLNSSASSTPYSLTIVGEGPMDTRLKKIIEEYKIEDFIEFTGPLTGNDLVKTLNEHKYILVPSRWKEPFGLVALEGMACGCIPIVADGGGLPEAVGNAGIIFKRNDISSLYIEVTNLIQNPQFEMEIRNKLSKHLSNHTSEIVCSKYFKAITKLYHLHEQN
ncbi:glycosyltransferase involved in cell wall biosynthesis [Gillisia mitskevichiae]|uniref:Glycosyltransferase involved in cell wall biosynthesis n=1 Tax=Gillisia mitskevichiae TaxID=270921 RepID=A0A495PWS1_9FLAO|nr:glycosyltransferase family 4 protein [Gillisia mitskevichiae]RKS53948.1 glycosyltransferase involved in cell wall biosynthesis [Gillisia mitskevichiae]